MSDNNPYANFYTYDLFNQSLEFIKASSDSFNIKEFESRYGALGLDERTTLGFTSVDETIISEVDKSQAILGFVYSEFHQLETELLKGIISTISRIIGWVTHHLQFVNLTPLTALRSEAGITEIPQQEGKSLAIIFKLHLNENNGVENIAFDLVFIAFFIDSIIRNIIECPTQKDMIKFCGRLQSEITVMASKEN